MILREIRVKSRERRRLANLPEYRSLPACAKLAWKPLMNSKSTIPRIPMEGFIRYEDRLNPLAGFASHVGLFDA